MKKVLLIFAFILVLTACKAANGNSVSKLETTIYTRNGHEEIVIEDAFNFVKNIFTDTDTFYYADLLTMEYGTPDSKQLEERIKNDTNSYEVLYIKFSFKTGNVAYAAMESNHIYNYETYLIKYYEHDEWHIYYMDGIL